MLDTKARKYIQPLFELVAKFFISKNISATKTTFIALLFGVLSAILILFEFNIFAVILLWISGFFDALDGTVARMTNTKTKLGGFLDIVFDRIVEILILFAIIYVDNNLYMIVCIVFACIILSMTIFLTSGNLIDENTNKAFYYQSGIAERSEGFIMLSLGILFTKYAFYILMLFAIIIFITAVQRFYQTYICLKGESK